MKSRGVAIEMKRTQDAVCGTLDWISKRVSPEVYIKVVAVAEQSVRYGIMKAVIDSEIFNHDIESEFEV